MLQSANQEIAKIRLTDLLDLTKNEATGPKVLLRIQNKTADYDVLQSDSGTIFTNYGDTGAITYTLPTSITKGWFAVFVNMVGYAMTVTGTADKLIAYNNAEADGIVTNTQHIGQAFLVISNGSAFVALAITAGSLTVTDA